MKALFPTSAYPFHNGHYEIYKKAVALFGKENVSVGIAQNDNKEKISFYEKISWMKPYGITSIVEIRDMTTADYCSKNDIKYLIRGIRNGNDAEYELNLSSINRDINPELETIFIPVDSKFNAISSSVIRELLKYNKTDIVKNHMNPISMYRFYNRIGFINVYFGRSCVGKSTFLKNLSPMVDFDSHVWKVLGEQHTELEIKSLKNSCHNLLYIHKEYQKFKSLCKKYLNDTFWNDFDKSIKDIHYLDWASIGFYWDMIPIHIKGRFKLIKVNMNDKDRAKLIIKKGFQNKVEILDKLYQDPPFFDESRDLKFLKHGV